MVKIWMDRPMHRPLHRPKKRNTSIHSYRTLHVVHILDSSNLGPRSLRPFIPLITSLRPRINLLIGQSAFHGQCHSSLASLMEQARRGRVGLFTLEVVLLAPQVASQDMSLSFHISR